MANFDRQRTEIQEVSGAPPGAYSGIDILTMPPVTVDVAVAQSLEKVVVVKLPAGFTGTPQLAKVWQSSGRLQPDYTLFCGYNASYVTPVATVSAIATTAVKKALADCLLAGYVGPAWQNTEKLIGWIYLQMSTAANAATFDSAEKKRPIILNLAFNNGNIPIADLDYGMGKNSAFAMLSQWDIYFVEDGKEMIMGYVNNEFGISELIEEAELWSGLPQAMISSTVTKVGAELTGNFQTFDPFIQNMVGNYEGVTETEMIKLSKTNKFQAVPKRYFILRGQTADGFLLEVHIPNGQIYRDGDVSVGGTDYKEYGFKIKANADDITGTTHRFDMSRTPVQIATLPVQYSGV